MYPNLLIISNKNKKSIVFVTYVKQKEYLCEKFYSYETKNIRKTRVFCLIREKVVTFRMVKLNMLLSIFLITK